MLDRWCEGAFIVSGPKRGGNGVWDAEGAGVADGSRRGGIGVCEGAEWDIEG